MTIDKVATGKRIRTLRQAHHFSMATLATMIGVAGKSTVSDWEKGRTQPSHERLVAIAQALQTSVGFLQHGDLNDYVFDVLKNDGLNNPSFNVLLWEYIDLTTTNPNILSGDVFNQHPQQDSKAIEQTDIDSFMEDAINQILPAVIPAFTVDDYPDPQTIITSACASFRQRIQLIRRTFTGKYNRIVRLLDNVDLYEKLGADATLKNYLNETTAVTDGYKIDQAYQQKMNGMITTFHQQLNALNADYQRALKQRRKTQSTGHDQ